MLHLNRKLITFFALSYIVIPLISWIGLTVFALRRVPDSAQTQNDRLIPIYNNQSFTQKITPLNNGLNTMYIYLKNARLLNTDPLKFVLTDANGNTLREIELSGRNIGDGDNIRFQFPPILDSSGKIYIVTLQAPYTNFDGTKIEAGVSSSDPGQLAYSLFYRPSSKSQVLLENINSIFSRLLNFKVLLLISISIAVWYTVLGRILWSNLSKPPVRE